MNDRDKAMVIGAAPEGASDQASAARAVQQMFSSLAPRYDLLNHVLSFNIDRWWWWRTARTFAEILSRPDARALDLCCGTGDMAFALQRRAGRRGARIVGADFAHPMLQRALGKSTESSPEWIEGDALRLPFRDATFDLVTTAFGFRNLANYEGGLKEIQRVLKPGGTVAILEFTEPPAGLAGDLYRWYCRKVLPKIGGLLSGNPHAYKYLPASVARFFHPDELASLMCKVGFASVEYQLWTLGSVGLHTGRKS